MSTRSFRVPLSARRRTGRSVALALAALLALSACAGTAPKDQSPATPEGLTTGIPAPWSAGIDDGKERYPDLGSMGMGCESLRRNC